MSPNYCINLRLPFDVVQEIWQHLGRVGLQNASLINSVFRNCSHGELFRALRFARLDETNFPLIWC